jgi:hypothetical protein
MGQSLLLPRQRASGRRPRPACLHPLLPKLRTPTFRPLPWPPPRQNSSDFYRWLSELEAARSSETEGKFRRYGAALERHLAACDALLALVAEALALFGRLREAHAAVAKRTAALHGTCERLVAERGRLEELAAAIREKLAYFDELEAVAAQVQCGCWQQSRRQGGKRWRCSMPASAGALLEQAEVGEVHGSRRRHAP